MSSDGVQLVKDSLGFATFVGRYTKLTRRGSRLLGCCPIHKEKTPSFNLDENKGFFHCFGCGKGGDLVRFCMEVEGLEFLDALEYLAEIAGIELPKRGKAGPGREVVEKIRDVNDAAVTFYQQQLARNEAAKAYLRERGISENTAKLFRLGFAPSQWDGLYLHLADKFDPQLLTSSGLFKEGRTGNPYDIFRGRIIFPIRDVYGHTVAFGGRLFGDEEGPKYINSPETPLYTKGKHVYNLDFAKVFLKKKPEAGVLVVEGYMDVIQLYQAGVTNVIAGLGTAFTPEQGKLLKRFIKRVVLNYDGDAAGFKAARAAIEIFLPLDLEIGVVTLPDKLDPDDFIRQKGTAAYAQKLARADDFFTYLLRYLSADKNIDKDPHMRSQVAHELVGVIDKIEDPVIHDHYMNKAASALSLSMSVLEQLHKPLPKSQNTPIAPKRQRSERSAPSAAPANSAQRPAPPIQTPQKTPSKPKQASQPLPAASAAAAPTSYGPDPTSYAPEPTSYAPDASAQPARPNAPLDDDGPPLESYEPPPEAYGSDEDEFHYEGSYQPPRPPVPQPARSQARRRPSASPFTKVEQEFLFHVMHNRDFINAVAEQHREILPKVLANIFADRRWVLDFIYDEVSATIGERLEAVPEDCRNNLAAVHFSEEFDEADSERLDQLCPDLLRAMLERLAEVNHQRMRMLPPAEEERKKALMRQNQELRRQASKL